MENDNPWLMVQGQAAVARIPQHALIYNLRDQCLFRRVATPTFVPGPLLAPGYYAGWLAGLDVKTGKPYAFLIGKSTHSTHLRLLLYVSQPPHTFMTLCMRNTSFVPTPDTTLLLLIRRLPVPVPNTLSWTDFTVMEQAFCNAQHKAFVAYCLRSAALAETVGPYHKLKRRKRRLEERIDALLRDMGPHLCAHPRPVIHEHVGYKRVFDITTK